MSGVAGGGGLLSLFERETKREGERERGTGRLLGDVMMVVVCT